MEMDNKLETLDAASALRMSQLQNSIVSQIEAAKVDAWRIRQANTAYALGDGVIVPGKHNFQKFLSCTVAGTTSADALTTDWDALSVGETVIDGTVTWTCSNRDDAPVSSVNGRSGAVVLNAAIIGAEEYGSVNSHNTSNSAHTALFNNKANATHVHAQSDVTGLADSLDAKAPLASPALTGTPTAPTAANGTNTTQIATTAFVNNVADTKLDVPAGFIFPFAGADAIPNGYLMCDGSLLSRTTYARLFDRIGTTYGAGDGSTTFNIPDLRGVFLRGANSGALDVGIMHDESLPNISGGYFSVGDGKPFYNYDGFHGPIINRGQGRTFAVSNACYWGNAVEVNASGSNPIYGAYCGKWVIKWQEPLAVGETVIVDGITYTVGSAETTLALQMNALVALFTNSTKWNVSYETSSATYPNRAETRLIFEAIQQGTRYPEIGGTAMDEIIRYTHESAVDNTQVAPKNYAVQYVIKY